MKQTLLRALIMGLCALVIFSLLSPASAGDGVDESLPGGVVLANDIPYGDIFPGQELQNQSGVVVNTEPVEGVGGLNPLKPDQEKDQGVEADTSEESKDSGILPIPPHELRERLPQGASRNKQALSHAGGVLKESFAQPTARGMTGFTQLLKNKLPTMNSGHTQPVLTIPDTEALKEKLEALLSFKPVPGEDKSPEAGLNEMQVVTVASTGALVLVGALVFGGSSTKSSAVALAGMGGTMLPLYSRIHKEKVFRHQRRQELYQLVSANPGASFNNLKEMSSLENGTLRHHLRTLEREHYIKSVKDGKFRRFYLRERKAPRLSRVQLMILQHIRANPDISQSDIAQLMEVSRQNVSYHIKKMEKQHILKVNRGDGGPQFEVFEKRW